MGNRVIRRIGCSGSKHHEVDAVGALLPVPILEDQVRLEVGSVAGVNGCLKAGMGRTTSFDWYLIVYILGYTQQ